MDPALNEDLHTYLRGARETLLWKLDGLGEYDIRRPMTPTGTNLLGLVKHNTATHLRYFGEVFGRGTTSRSASPPADRSAEFWAGADEARDDIIASCRRSWDTADATIADLPLDTVGRVAWWGDEPVTLHRVLVHVTAESQRHAGHADIIRELIDGAAGLLRGHDNLAVDDPAGRRELVDRIDAAARLASDS